ncbi:MAG: hypothetical protein NC541_09380 [bacterium]|nr:hypothetical protein [bacterium]MCM1500428.1 hypothetical protein [Clostridium sp.]
MKAQKLKPGKTHNRTAMYWFDYSRDIIVEERQTDTLDRVILHYTVRDGDKAYFSEEYIPEGTPQEKTKKPDVTAILENVTETKVKWYIFDLKDTVIHAKTALKLCNQWHSGIEHIEEQYLSELDGYSVEGSLGVITRYWSRELLQKEKDTYEEKINRTDENTLLTARKSMAKRNEYRQRVKAIQYILDGIFIDNDVSGEGIFYDIHYVYMTTTDKITYTAEMTIKF